MRFLVEFPVGCLAWVFRGVGAKQPEMQIYRHVENMTLAALLK